MKVLINHYCGGEYDGSDVLIPLEYESVEKLYCDFDALIQAKVVEVKENINKYAEHIKKEPKERYNKNKIHFGVNPDYKEWFNNRPSLYTDDKFNIGSHNFYYNEFINVKMFDSKKPETWTVEVSYPEFLTLDEWFEQNRVN